MVSLSLGLPELAPLTQAYEGLETARSLREEYVFVPAKVREVYLAHLLGGLEEQHSVRSAIVFCATCRRAPLRSPTHWDTAEGSSW